MGKGPIVGLSRQEFRECLVEAAKMRLLPISSTTSTTIGGLLPLALSGGPLWEGMAWSMIFGLIIASKPSICSSSRHSYAIFVETFRVQPIPKPVESVDS